MGSISRTVSRDRSDRHRFVTSLLTMRSLYGRIGKQNLRSAFIRNHRGCRRRRRSRRSPRIHSSHEILMVGRIDAGTTINEGKDTHENRSCSQPRRLLRRRGGVTHPESRRDGRRPPRQQPAVEIAFTKWVNHVSFRPGSRYNLSVRFCTTNVSSRSPGPEGDVVTHFVKAISTAGCCRVGLLPSRARSG